MSSNTDNNNQEDINVSEDSNDINNEEDINNNAQDNNNLDDYIIDIDEIIKKLYPFENKQMSQKLKNEQIKLVTESNLLKETELKYLCMKSMEIFMKESSLLELTAPIIICGDIHGQYRDLIRLFDFGESPKKKTIFIFRRLCRPWKKFDRMHCTSFSI